MAGPDGIVVAVESSPSLIERALASIRKQHRYLLDTRRVVFVEDSGARGWSYYAPYDAIHVGGAVRAVPEEMTAQLMRGGRLVIPVGTGKDDQQLFTVDKTTTGEIRQQAVMTVTFAPLVPDDEEQTASTTA
jgi:protein-L-isoaspartate(D-aspartate) O-methyltransferase